MESKNSRLGPLVSGTKCIRDEVDAQFDFYHVKERSYEQDFVAQSSYPVTSNAGETRSWPREPSTFRKVWVVEKLRKRSL